jgi:hypothetical protein
MSWASTVSFDRPELDIWVGGACFPKSFLARYAAIDPPDLCHDDLRLPLFAQILGYPVIDTGFRRRWDDQDEDRFFSLHAREIDLSTIGAELAKPDGRRVFHPVRAVFRGWR